MWGFHPRSRSYQEGEREWLSGEGSGSEWVRVSVARGLLGVGWPAGPLPSWAGGLLGRSPVGGVVSPFLLSFLLSFLFFCICFVFYFYSFIYFSVTFSFTFILDL